MENENPLEKTENKIQTRPGSIPIDKETVVQLKEQRAVLLEYVSSQLKKVPIMVLYPEPKNQHYSNPVPKS